MFLHFCTVEIEVFENLTVLLGPGFAEPSHTRTQTVISPGVRLVQA